MKVSETAMAMVRQARVIAVVGLSSKPARASYGVARYLQRQGYRIVPVNPGEREVLGEPAYTDLDAAAAGVAGIEIVDVFRRSEHVPAVAEAAIRIGAKLLWLQEGVTHPEAEAAARAAGLEVVANRCLLKQHARLAVPAHREA
ncbi:MAG: CoA-binding protein [Terriglobales bacterium]